MKKGVAAGLYDRFTRKLINLKLVHIALYAVILITRIIMTSISTLIMQLHEFLREVMTVLEFTLSAKVGRRDVFMGELPITIF